MKSLIIENIFLGKIKDIEDSKGKKYQSSYKKEPIKEEHLLTLGAVAIDNQRMTISWQGSIVDLTITEFWMVYALAKHPGHVKNRQQLMQDSNIYVDDSTITSHIKRIRKKFAVIDKSFDCIETVYGMGYRWNQETPATKL